MPETAGRLVGVVELVRLAVCVVAAMSGVRLAAADDECYRDPATGFEIHRARSVILVDAALQRLSPPAATASTAPVWQRALESVEWLMHRLPEGSEYAVMLGDKSIDPDETSKWWRAGSAADAQRAFDALRAHGAPAREVDLASEVDAAMALEPKPERLLLIVGALPGYPASDGKAQLAAFNRMTKHVKPGVAVDVLLMPLASDWNVATAYWVLALRTDGSLLTVGSDWPTVANDGLGDSEYIAFVLDTSNSMKLFRWRWAQQRLEEVLRSQRRLRFFQVLNDNGTPLLDKQPSWAAATPEREAEAMGALEKWQPWSESSPLNGLAVAIEQVRTVPNSSVYLIGDDWAADSLEKLEKKLGPEGFGNVRVSAVALPTIYEVANGEMYTAADYAAYVHEIVVRTGGALLAAPTGARAKGNARLPNPAPPQCSRRR
jgi:hypothetical protein